MSKSPPSEASANSDRAAGRLAGSVVPPGLLGRAERDQMYALLQTYFEGTTRAQFEEDLGEKEWVFLLRDAASREVQGFSTLLRFALAVEDQPVVAFFSGDTIIARAYWGEATLPRLWLQHVFKLAGRIREARAYWFLICSGYKTYRFLPVFFREFHPHWRDPMPAQTKRLLDTLGHARFAERYDAARGIVRLAQATPLQRGVAEITAERARDPHVAFFARANPGHLTGEDLACVCELTRENLTSAGRRLVGKPEPN